MTSPFEVFAPLFDLIRTNDASLVERTVVIGGVALLDWEIQQQLRFGVDAWGSITRTTTDIDIVIAAANDRGWQEALVHAGWVRDARRPFRWTPPDADSCAVDLLGQFGGDVEAGGSIQRLGNYWGGGEEGAYICRVLRAYQGRQQFPTMLVEPFWDPLMQGLGLQRLNHMGLALSKISALGMVLVRGDSELAHGTTSTSRLLKDAQDTTRLLRGEVAAAVNGWAGQAVLEQLVSGLVDEILDHLTTIRAVADGSRTSEHLSPDHHPHIRQVAQRLPVWRRRESQG